MLRLLGGMFILVGLILTLTVMGATVGIPLMVLGLLFMAVGGKRTVIVHMTDASKK